MAATNTCSGAEESFHTWLDNETPKVADRYQEARKTDASVVAKAKIVVWEEFGEGLSVGLKEVLTERSEDSGRGGSLVEN